MKERIKDSSGDSWYVHHVEHTEGQVVDDSRQTYAMAIGGSCVRVRQIHPFPLQDSLKMAAILTKEKQIYN